MALTTAVHCPGCGYDNHPQYKFCGMCGTALSGATPAKGVRTKDAALTVGGYSILGLAQEPIPSAMPTADSQQNSSQRRSPRGSQENDTPHLQAPHRDSPTTYSQSSIAPRTDPQQDDLLNRNLDYLFEDDQKKDPPRWRLYLALALLAIAVAALVWQWQRNGYPWNDLTPLTSGPNTGTAPAAAGYPNAAQNPTANPGTDILRKPEAGLASHATSSAPPKPESVKSESPSSEPTNPEPQKTLPLQPASEAQSSPAALHPAEAIDSEQLKSTGPSASDKPASSTVADQVAPAAENPEPPANAPNAAPAAPEQPSSPAQAVELVAEGTKYLFGSGVEQDCDRAQKDLRAAAHFSSEAESMLGTMYASGHCAGRDLPTAYRWYARALHSKPENTRIQSDLTVLWNQMTPAERQAATRSAP